MYSLIHSQYVYKPFVRGTNDFKDSPISSIVAVCLLTILIFPCHAHQLYFSSTICNQFASITEHENRVQDIYPSWLLSEALKLPYSGYICGLLHHMNTSMMLNTGVCFQSPVSDIIHSPCHSVNIKTTNKVKYAFYYIGVKTYKVSIRIVNAYIPYSAGCVDEALKFYNLKTVDEPNNKRKLIAVFCGHIFMETFYSKWHIVSTILSLSMFYSLAPKAIKLLLQVSSSIGDYERHKRFHNL